VLLTICLDNLLISSSPIQQIYEKYIDLKSFYFEFVIRESRIGLKSVGWFCFKVLAGI
jgi:hypothetical protein